MTVQNYRGLIAWQKSMELVKLIYESSSTFPREEIYGLTGQLRRAAISIPSNIAEGQGRSTTKDFLRHISIAYGSLSETETQILISEMLNYLSPEKSNLLLERCSEVGRLINGLKNSLEKKLD